MDKLVSIIVPVYNTDRRLLEKCVDSLICQSYKNIEIILIDDGSHAETSDLCEELSHKDMRIRVKHKQNGGLSSARNAGLDVTEGSLISFVDSDDHLHPDSIQNMVNAHTKFNSGIVCMGSRITDDQGTILEKSGNDTHKCETINSVEYIKGICRKQLSESVCDKLFSATLLRNRRFETGRLNEDFLFLSKILMEGQAVTLLDFSGYYYLKHSGTITSDRLNFKSLKDAIRNSCELADYASARNSQAYIHFVYSALFQTKVLLTLLPKDKIGSGDWNFCTDTITKYNAWFNRCNLSLQDKLLIRGFVKIPRITKVIYSILKRKS